MINSNVTEYVPSAFSPEIHRLSIFILNPFIIPAQQNLLPGLRSANSIHFSLNTAKKQSSTVMDKIDGSEILAFWIWGVVILGQYSNLDSVQMSGSKTERRWHGDNVVYFYGFVLFYHRLENYCTSIQCILMFFMHITYVLCIHPPLIY